MDPHQIVTKAEWIETRRALLAKEKELTRLRDRLAQEQRALPWVKIENSYVFDGLEGKVHWRTFRWPQSAFRQALHDGSRHPDAMRRLLLSGRPH